MAVLIERLVYAHYISIPLIVQERLVLGILRRNTSTRRWEFNRDSVPGHRFGRS